MKTVHRKNLLKELLVSGKKLTATDFSYVSNANQYFVELEKLGLINSEWGMKGDARVKLRFVPIELKEKAKKYLGLSSKNDD